MPNWKKMAEAFGRAMNERMKDGKTAKIINSSEIAAKANTPGIYKDKDMDAIQAYRRGQAEGSDNYFMGIDRAQEASGKAFPRRSDISRQISRTEDENSSRRLQDEFDKAFDEAVARRNYNTDYDEADRLFTGKRANESMERFDEMFPEHWKATDEEREPMLREFMIEELKRGTPIEDVLYLPSELRRTGPID